jgi:hypothetical protein
MRPVDAQQRIGGGTGDTQFDQDFDEPGFRRGYVSGGGSVSLDEPVEPLIGVRPHSGEPPRLRLGQRKWRREDDVGRGPLSRQIALQQKQLAHPLDRVDRCPAVRPFRPDLTGDHAGKRQSHDQDDSDRNREKRS